MNAYLSSRAHAAATDNEVLLSVEDLSVAYRVDGQDVAALADVGFSLRRGETTALLGESGSGKSTIAGSIAGNLADAARASGRIRFAQHDLLRLSERELRPLRGTEIGYVPQNPARSLDPLIPIGRQLEETLRVHGLREPSGARQARILGLLQRVGFRDPAAVAQRYPHELSGGMQQRVLIAIALTFTPRILIADEPTSALDVTVQKSILDLIDQRKAEDLTAVLLVTHDIGVAAERSQNVVVLRHGRIVEAGPTDRVLRAPQHEYTRQLLRDVPGADAGRRAPRAPAIPGIPAPAIRLHGVSVDYASRRGAAHRAVNDVSFSVKPGTTLAIVGESGSGKTTTARAIARFIAPSAGEIEVRDAAGALLAPDRERGFRRRVQYVYQNPYLSLNPRHRIQTVLAEPLRAFEIGDARSRQARIEALLDMVALPQSALARRARELSGGQLQRVAIARALAAEPSILVLDEPVSALDVTVQAQILRLLEGLQAELGLTYLFISHDLAVVRRIADEIAVMREGRIVEHGPTEQVYLHPAHAYTRQLLDAVPGLPASALDNALPAGDSTLAAVA
ncbi:Glutathione import ATP-binding protein GsiA [compost metagenome]